MYLTDWWQRVCGMDACLGDLVVAELKLEHAEEAHAACALTLQSYTADTVQSYTADTADTVEWLTLALGWAMVVVLLGAVWTAIRLAQQLRRSRAEHARLLCGLEQISADLLGSHQRVVRLERENDDLRKIHDRMDEHWAAIYKFLEATRLDDTTEFT
jgi:hypothetical protein